jgi:hypothetical protein
MKQQGKGRAKSVQWDRSLLSQASNDDDLSRTGRSSPPVPGNRTSSLPQGENKENMITIRHYRSMLDVEAAPILPAAVPLTFDDLAPRPPEPEPHSTSAARETLACQSSHSASTDTT